MANGSQKPAQPPEGWEKLIPRNGALQVIIALLVGGGGVVGYDQIYGNGTVGIARAQEKLEDRVRVVETTLADRTSAIKRGAEAMDAVIELKAGQKHLKEQLEQNQKRNDEAHKRQEKILQDLYNMQARDR